MPEEGKKLNQFDNQLASMSNALARKISGETSNENKLLMMTISQLDPYHENSNKVKLKKTDVFKTLGLTGNDRYMRTKKTLQKLLKSSFVDLTKDDIKGDFEGIAGYVLPTLETNYRSEFYTIKVNPDFMPHMQLLKSYYTTIQLDSIVAFNSIFAHRLYQYICSWQDKEESYLTTEELKELFNLGKDDYVRGNGKFDRYNFEIKTLNIAIEEINEYSEFKVTYEKIKKGNRVRFYKLTWHRVDEIEERQTTFKELIYGMINWDELFNNYPNFIVGIVKEVYEEIMKAPDKRTYNINGNRLNGIEVKTEYKELTTFEIISILEELNTNNAIKNPRNWIISALYNAKINQQYKDQKELENISHDMPSTFEEYQKQSEERIKNER
mgnify:CR=1 FL=1